MRIRKELLFLIGVFFSVAFLFTQPCAATSLTFDPSGSIIGVGNSINIDIVISGLDGSGLGGFDLKVNYDSAILNFNSYTLGNALGDIGAGHALDLSSGDLGVGAISIVELSLLSDLSSQPDTFTLATVSFTGIGIGTSPLFFSEVILSDASGNDLTPTLNAGSVSVPEPAAVFLLVTGLVGLAGFRRKFKNT